MKKIKYLIFISLMFFNINKVSGATLSDVEDAFDDATVASFLNGHPTGSIYVTTASDENTVAKMTAKYGGTWEAYGTDRVLRGTTETAGQTGGSTSQTLSVSNLPEHTHSIPVLSGTAASTGSGYTLSYNTTETNNATSDTNSVGHTHSIPAMSGSAASNGAHTHTVSGSTASGGSHTHSLSLGGNALTVHSTTGNVGINDAFAYGNGTGWWYNHHKRQCVIAEAGAHTHTVSATVATNGAHTHTVTTTAKASGDESQKHTHTYTSKYATSVSGLSAHTHSVSTTASTTAKTGKSSPDSFSVEDAYITVYMYKRIS